MPVSGVSVASRTHPPLAVEHPNPKQRLKMYAAPATDRRQAVQLNFQRPVQLLSLTHETQHPASGLLPSLGSLQPLRTTNIAPKAKQNSNK